MLPETTIPGGEPITNQNSLEHRYHYWPGLGICFGTFWSQRPEERRMGLNSRKARGFLFAARLLQRLNSQEIQGKWLLPSLPLSQPWGRDAASLPDCRGCDQQDIPSQSQKKAVFLCSWCANHAGIAFRS